MKKKDFMKQLKEEFEKDNPIKKQDFASLMNDVKAKNILPEKEKDEKKKARTLLIPVGLVALLLLITGGAIGGYLATRSVSKKILSIQENDWKNKILGKSRIKRARETRTATNSSALVLESTPLQVSQIEQTFPDIDTAAFLITSKNRFSMVSVYETDETTGSTITTDDFVTSWDNAATYTLNPEEAKLDTSPEAYGTIQPRSIQTTQANYSIRDLDNYTPDYKNVYYINGDLPYSNSDDAFKTTIPSSETSQEEAKETLSNILKALLFVGPNAQFKDNFKIVIDSDIKFGNEYISNSQNVQYSVYDISSSKQEVKIIQGDFYFYESDKETPKLVTKGYGTSKPDQIVGDTFDFGFAGDNNRFNQGAIYNTKNTKSVLVQGFNDRIKITDNLDQEKGIDESNVEIADDGSISFVIKDSSGNTITVKDSNPNDKVKTLDKFKFEKDDYLKNVPSSKNPYAYYEFDPENSTALFKTNSYDADFGLDSFNFKPTFNLGEIKDGKLIEYPIGMFSLYFINDIRVETSSINQGVIRAKSAPSDKGFVIYDPSTPFKEYPSNYITGVPEVYLWEKSFDNFINAKEASESYFYKSKLIIEVPDDTTDLDAKKQELLNRFKQVHGKELTTSPTYNPTDITLMKSAEFKRTVEDKRNLIQRSDKVVPLD